MFDGTLTQSVYLARLSQIITYCRSKGIWYYATGGDLRLIGGANPAFYKTWLAAQATVLQTFGSTVMGFDMCNEVNATYTSLYNPGDCPSHGKAMGE